MGRINLWVPRYEAALFGSHPVARLIKRLACRRTLADGVIFPVCASIV